MAATTKVFDPQTKCPACGKPEKANTLDGVTYASCGVHIRIVR